MSKDPIEKEMLRAGRAHLNIHSKMSPEDYSVKQAMAHAAPTHTKPQQIRVLNVLRQEFKKRGA